MKITSWDKRNVEYNNSRELVVRQHFAILDETITNLDGTKYVVDSFTLRNGRTNELWHYVMTAGTGLDLPTDSPQINVYNEDMILMFTYEYDTFVRVPPVMTYAVVEDELLIECPGLPAVWGLVGGGLRPAVLTDPVNQNTASLTEFPRGICISWAGRAVVADGSSLYFSDALDPRAFTGANFINPPGEYIYDMHVNSGGALIIVTSNGVYSLPEEASYSGIGGIVLPVWTKLTDYQATGYRKSVSYKGRVYGLTQRGFTLIDERTSKEVSISEKTGSRFYRGKVDYSDYREGRVLKYVDGIIICMTNFACFVDLGNELVSWYNTRSSKFDSLMDIRGMLYEPDGNDIFLLRGYAVVKNGNNGEPASDSSDNTPVYATMSGRVPHPPKSSPVLRCVTFMSDAVSVDLFATVNESNVVKVLPSFFPQLDLVDTTDTGLVAEIKKKSRRFKFVSRSDEIFLELGVEGNPSSVPLEVDIDFKGPGKNRP